MNWSPQSLKSRVQHLPPLPQTTQRLLDMLEDDDLTGNMKHIETQILTDPILAGRILQIANSSFYGMHQHVVSISQACAILGLHTVKNLVYTMALMARFNQPHDMSVVNYRDVWCHSLLTAAIAGSAAKNTHINSAATFTMGLFHNIGLLIMDFLYPTVLAQQINLARRHRYSMLAATRAMSAPSHQSMAVSVLEIWNFPPSIIAPFTEASSNAGSLGDAMQLVTLASVLANGLGFTYLDGIPPEWPETKTASVLDKDLAELWPSIDAGLALYRDLLRALL